MTYWKWCLGYWVRTTRGEGTGRCVMTFGAGITWPITEEEFGQLEERLWPVIEKDTGYRVLALNLISAIPFREDGV